VGEKLKKKGLKLREFFFYRGGSDIKTFFPIIPAQQVKDKRAGNGIKCAT
jgi:hypothetical protein